MTKNEVKKIAKTAKQIIKEESDGRMIETVVTFDEMVNSLNECSRWAGEQYGNKVLVSSTLCAFTIEL